MHRGHDHESVKRRRRSCRRAGHRPQSTPPRAEAPAQWQTPHRDRAVRHARAPVTTAQADLDLVEAAFVEAFRAAADPTSFLRLAQVPFEATAADGARLALLRVEVEAVTDVGA